MGEIIASDRDERAPRDAPRRRAPGRPRAADHDAKRRLILDCAARLFAQRGYLGTSITDIARACGTSKTLLYHYYPSKEQVLFDILRLHLSRLLETVETASASPREGKAGGKARLRRIIGALLDAYEGADDTHKVQMNDLSLLPTARQEELKAIERRIVTVMATALVEINPRLARGRRLLKPVTMSLFGILNWHHLWFRADGTLSRAAFADLVADMIVAGARKVA